MTNECLRKKTRRKETLSMMRGNKQQIIDENKFLTHPRILNLMYLTKLVSTLTELI